ncbi:MAG: hypothetical protein CMO81_00295 [Waddliaceae bacterium]|nr:hypothetical protein [Waddliaceae bacterium]|tara:strand:+ start:1797 stop:2225 length:429 start_codon:yes stop_codon:yes gene_type:complete
MRKPYPSDLTNEEWDVVEPIINESNYRRASSKGKYPRREKLNAIFYVLRTGCQWTDLPHDFPPWKSVYSQFLRWRERDLFSKMNARVRKRPRKVLGKEPNPSAGIADSQSVKGTEKKGSPDTTELRKLRVGNDIFWLITLGF